MCTYTFSALRLLSPLYLKNMVSISSGFNRAHLLASSCSFILLSKGHAFIIFGCEMTKKCPFWPQMLGTQDLSLSLASFCVAK